MNQTCDSSDVFCEKKPITIDHLEDNKKPLNEADKVSLLTNKSLNDRIRYLESKLYELQEEFLKHIGEEEYNIIINITETFKNDENQSDSFYALHNFSQSTTSYGNNLDEIEFDFLIELSDVNTNFYSYLKEIEEEIKIDAIFKDHIDWKDSVTKKHKNLDEQIDQIISKLENFECDISNNEIILDLKNEINNLQCIESCIHKEIDSIRTLIDTQFVYINTLQTFSTLVSNEFDKFKRDVEMNYVKKDDLVDIYNLIKNHIENNCVDCITL
jgi:hypothetical protein